MQFLEKYNLTPLKVFKIILIVIAALVVASVLLASVNTARHATFNSSNTISIPSAPTMRGGKMMSDTSNMYESSGVSAPMPPLPGGYTSGDSEAFEVTDYTASIETRNLSTDCDRISDLKSRSEVIFESTNEYKRGCAYTFKVEKDTAQEIVGLIASMNPKQLSESTYTIKQEVDGYVSEIDILKRKLETLDSTLADAVAAYNDITATAKTVGDAETLARIIESKIGIIERLTNARIQTVAELDRYEKAKRDAQDRMAYTHFSVTIYESTYIDGAALRDSWKQEAQAFFNNTNGLVQELSIGLAFLILSLLKYVLYFFILLIVGRFVWSATKKIWQKGEPSTTENQ